jgi:SAM-dependent methyltransferase
MPDPLRADLKRSSRCLVVFNKNKEIFMSTAESFEYDDIGKIDLTNIYERTDPRQYYSTLRRLEYIIPETAKPVFQHVIEAYRHSQDKDKIRIIDVGCSYGINAAILKGDLEMEHLYELYGPAAVGRARRDQLLGRDQTIAADLFKGAELEVVGLDASANAIKYAVEANLLDDGVATDLESGRPSPEVAAVLDDADLVISTGCVGYVGESTFKGILEINAPRQPWMVHFVLRMFPFDAIRDTLGTLGYVTEKLEDQTFLQRRFASEEEQVHVLERLAGLGIDASGLEADGWYHAEAFISRPGDARVDLRLDDITSD